MNKPELVFTGESGPASVLEKLRKYEGKRVRIVYHGLEQGDVSELAGELCLFGDNAAIEYKGNFYKRRELEMSDMKRRFGDGDPVGDDAKSTKIEVYIED